jgi:hypothetical protein
LPPLPTHAQRLTSRGCPVALVPCVVDPYVLTEDGVRFEAARMVTDAVAYGTQEIGRRATRTRLR